MNWNAMGPGTGRRAMGLVLLTVAAIASVLMLSGMGYHVLHLGQRAWGAVVHGQDKMKEEGHTEEKKREKRVPMAATQAPQTYAMVPAGRQQLIGLKTGTVTREDLRASVRAVGRVEYDEQRITHVNLRISGWVQELLVDYTGRLVRKGEGLFTLYSPDLVAAQDEYLVALRAREQVKHSSLPEVMEQAEQMVQAARDRLRLWSITDRQIADLARRGKGQTSLTVFSPVTGHVIDKKAFKGMYVEPSMTVYTIADLSTIWVLAEVFETDVPFLKVGQHAKLAFVSYPGQTFHGRVSYVYPYLNKEARTVRVRVELLNPTFQLKPDMYGEVTLAVDRGNALVVPESAVLDSGQRQVVFVVRGEGIYEPREVQLGVTAGGVSEVIDGLHEGEEIVTSGNFLLDSESKLMASTNMMGALGMGGIKMEQARMGWMEMGGMPMQRDGGGSGTVPPVPAQQSERVDGLTVTLWTVPASARVGENEVQVKIGEENGKPLRNARVQLTYTMPMLGMSAASASMAPTQTGEYRAKVNLGMGGRWDLTISIRRPDQADVRVTFSVTAGPGGMAQMPGM